MPNPIMLKELRQSVRNRMVTVSLIGFFGLLLIILSTLFRAFSSTDASPSEPSGHIVFGFVSAILSLVELLVVPFIVFQRLTAERGKGKADLLFSTPLKAPKIVDGKILAGMAMELLFLAAALPFLLLSYQLRGIALETILVYALMLLPAGACSIALGLLIGTFPIANAGRRMLYGLILFGAIGPVIAISVALAQEDILTDVGSSQALFYILFLILTAFLLLRAAAIFSISPASTVRVRAFRATAFALLLVWIAVAVIGAFRTSKSDILEVFHFCALLLASVFMVYAIAMPPGENRRTLLEIQPRLRPVQFLFSSAAVGGILFSLLLAALALLIIYNASYVLSGSVFEMPFLPSFLYFASFAILLWLIARALPKFPSPVSMSLCAILVPFAWSVITIIPSSRSGEDCLVPGNLFAPLDTSAYPFHLNVSFVCFAVVFSVFLPFVVRAYRNFRHP